TSRSAACPGSPSTEPTARPARATGRGAPTRLHCGRSQPPCLVESTASTDAPDDRRQADRHLHRVTRKRLTAAVANDDDAVPLFRREVTKMTRLHHQIGA